MSQAITTRYLPPTNTRGSRVKATSAAGQHVTITWDYALDASGNHAAAAKELATRLRWQGDWHCGSTDDGYVFVLSNAVFAT